MPVCVSEPGHLSVMRVSAECQSPRAYDRCARFRARHYGRNRARTTLGPCASRTPDIACDCSGTYIHIHVERSRRRGGRSATGSVTRPRRPRRGRGGALDTDGDAATASPGLLTLLLRAVSAKNDLDHLVLATTAAVNPRLVVSELASLEREAPSLWRFWRPSAPHGPLGLLFAGRPGRRRNTSRRPLPRLSRRLRGDDGRPLIFCFPHDRPPPLEQHTPEIDPPPGPARNLTDPGTHTVQPQTSSTVPGLHTGIRAWAADLADRI